MTLLEEPGVLKIYHDEKFHLQIHEWLDYNPEDRDELILHLLDQIYKLLKEYPVKKVLVKADAVQGAFSPEVQKFIKNIQFPRLLADTPLCFVATVKPVSQLEKSSTNLWQEQLKQHSKIIMHDVASENDAREWLEKIEEIAKY